MSDPEDLVAKLKGQLPLDHVEGLVEVVVVESWAGPRAGRGLGPRELAGGLLVAQQPLGRQVEVGQAGGEANDRQTRPGDVVLPQRSHAVAELQLAGRQLV